MSGQQSELFRSKSQPQIPFLVKIQTIDLHSLDFRSSLAKNKHVTFVDGTSRFIYVGCTSGTVYVFARDNLQFLMIIPFKGGKVCSIASTEDESDVAVGSLPGQVTIFRLLKARNSSIAHSKSGPLPVSVKQLYSVTHHQGNEITEMHWSPNGRYLFIGDNQGLISQVDVGSLDEFPWPSPSRVILQVQSRVLQLDCVFPYLAVNTLAGVFLCDIENEDFTRIHSGNKRPLLATGICLAVNGEETEEIPTASLYISPQNSSTILRYGIQGNLLQTLEFQNSFVCTNELPLFDPKKEVKLNANSGNDSTDFRVTFGKLYSTDENYLISASHHRIIFLDPGTSTVICWNDDFRRISAVKVLSNYLFLWESHKLHIVAISSFQAYGMQLIGAGLTKVLTNWLTHCLNAIGWNQKLQDFYQRRPSEISEDTALVACKNEERSVKTTENMQDEEESTAENLSSLPKLENPVEEDLTEELENIKLRFKSLLKSQNLVQGDLKTFIEDHVPKILQDSLGDEDEIEVDNVEKEIPPPPNPMLEALNSLYSSLLEETQKENQKELKAIHKLLRNFYNEVQVQLPHNLENSDEDSVIFKQSLFQSKMTLETLIQSTSFFLKQEPLLKVLKELKSDPNLSEKIDEIVKNIIWKLLRDEEEPSTKFQSNSFLIVNFGKQNSVKRWLTEFKTPISQIQKDTISAEMLLLMLPFLSNDLFARILKDWLSGTQSKLFSWLVLLINSSERKLFPFGRKLQEFLGEKFRGNAINEVISVVYEDLWKSPEDQHSIHFIHHFASLLQFKSRSKNSKSKILSALITGFPLKNFEDDDIKSIILNLLTSNPVLLEMYMEGCLTDGNSQNLCKCGLPEFYGLPGLFMIPRTQRLIEETILKILLTQKTDGTQVGDKVPCKFAMRRLLLDKYFQLMDQISDSALDDRVKLEIILRSGECHLLQKHFHFTLNRLQIFKELYGKIFQQSNADAVVQNCSGCAAVLKRLPNFRIMSWDCIGLWILGDKTLSENEKLTKIVRESEDLNRPGRFSLTFYRFLAQSGQEAFDEDSIGFESARRLKAKRDNRSVCAAFH